MSVPFSFKGAAASRQPFVDFNTDFKVYPTVGMNADSDLQVYVCDDDEELRRINGGRLPRDTTAAPPLTGGEGIFESMFADGSPKNERNQVSGAGSPPPSTAEVSARETASEGAHEEDLHYSGQGNRATKPAPASKPGKGAWGTSTPPSAYILKTG